VKLALLSDIHSNLSALETALDLISQKSVDAVYCMGDVVGYGPDAAACVDLVRKHCTGVVCGNHDIAVALEKDIGFLPKEGQVAARHNRKQLSRDQLDYLAKLPLVIEADGCTFVHATPCFPETWQRLDNYLIAQAQFEHFKTDVCFLGHTHLPAVMADRLGVLRVRAGHRFLINVGSVGQPRDGNPRLCVSFFDTESFEYELERVPYDVDRTCARIRDEGLPGTLARRLAAGR